MKKLDTTIMARSVSMPRWVWDRLDELSDCNPTGDKVSRTLVGLLLGLHEFEQEKDVHNE